MLSVHAGLLATAEKERDKRLVAKVLHYLPQVRRKLDPETLATLLGQSASTPLVAMAMNLLSGSETMMAQEKVAPSPTNGVYVLCLTGIYLLDKAQYQQAANIFLETARLMETMNKRLLDPLLARCYYFLGRAFELGQLGNVHNVLMLALRLAALRHDYETHAAVFNMLLRMLILGGGQVEEAAKLVQKIVFSEAASGANQARYHYYLACIHAIQADYAEAKEDLGHALRKAPHGPTAIGFVQATNKLLVVVQLLLGEIPERALFRQSHLSKALRPYLALAQSVRLGDLARFQNVVTQSEGTFDADRTLVLVQRLHHNVLKAGLKRLSLAYARIHLTDVQTKLCLSSVDDAAFVLLKAINDGVIEGEVNHAEGYLQTHSTPNPYYTTEPQEALHSRIETLNALHNDCLRAMRYPMGVKKTTTGEAMPTEAELMEEFLDAEDDLGF